MKKHIAIPVFKTQLLVDAMYYHAANHSYEHALTLTGPIEKAELRIKALQEKWNNAEKKYKDDRAERYAVQEPIAIQMEDADYGVGVAYGPYLQALATTHIMSAAALESHINARGRQFLKGKTWDHFERITLEAKWLFLPLMLGTKGFDPGAEPYQGFAKLISRRNELVHYKPREENWQPLGSPVPSFLAKLGLTKDATVESLESVQRMIENLADQLKEKPPHWLQVGKANYFHVQIR